jgi:anti-anti-sigma regulatory factor
MEIEIRDHDGAKIVALSGDIDMYTSPELRKRLLLLSDQKSKEATLADRSDSSLARFLSEALSQGLNEANATITKSLP